MCIYTDFSMLDKGNIFPPYGLAVRDNKYRLNETRFRGTYADGNKFIMRDGDGNTRELMWQRVKLNKFKLYSNKMISLIFNREPIVQCGDNVKTNQINKLIGRTGWMEQVRQAIKNMEIYGDSTIKTYTGGASAFSPINAFKVVYPGDTSKVKAYVLSEYIKDTDGKVKYVRLETHFKGYIHEMVCEYNGVSIGEPVKYNYFGRNISKGGNTHYTGLDEFMVQWLSCDVTEENIYGQSPYDDFAELVHEIERRQTLGIKVLDAHTEPMLAVSAGFLKNSEITGKSSSGDILGNIIEVRNGQEKPAYIEYNGKLENSLDMIELLNQQIYEVTELGKTFMTGEYSGNISDETLSSIVKSATDRANRHVNDIYTEVIKSLYVLCRLNNIDITLDELTITFQIGQTEGIKNVADVFNSRVEKGTISLYSGLKQYYGLTDEQALEEIEIMKRERDGL